MTLLKRCIVSFGLFLSGIGVGHAQMGIGTLTPDPAAELDIQSTDKGILIPRIALKGSDDQTTITAGNVESLLIYNTTQNSELQPGFYVWFDNQWRRLLTDSDSDTSPSVKVIENNYGATLNDQVLIGKPQHGNITIELPDPNGQKGKELTIKKEDDNEDYYINIQGNIEGIPSGEMLYTAVPHTGWKLISNGTSWLIIDKL